MIALSEGTPYSAFDLIRKIELDPLEIDFIAYKISKNPIPENEIEFIKLAKKISSIHSKLSIEKNDHWAYHSKEISDGTYPLELLPEHVRLTKPMQTPNLS